MFAKKLVIFHLPECILKDSTINKRPLFPHNQANIFGKTQQPTSADIDCYRKSCTWKWDEFHVSGGVTSGKWTNNLASLQEAHRGWRRHTEIQTEIRGCKSHIRGLRWTTFLSHSASETLHAAAKEAHSRSMGVIGSHPKPFTRCVDKTMGLAWWKMSGVLIITKVEIKAFVIPAKVIKESQGFLRALCRNGKAWGT